VDGQAAVRAAGATQRSNTVRPAQQQQRARFRSSNIQKCPLQWCGVCQGEAAAVCSCAHLLL
jgi:hypothetical protein